MANDKKQQQAQSGHGYGEMIARFQLETERALEELRQSIQAQQGDLAVKVARVEDRCNEMSAQVSRQSQQLEESVHHARQGVRECNEAMKVAVKAARDAADSAAVFVKLRDAQPDFAAHVCALEERLASVRDKNAHIEERLNGLTRRLDEFEVVAEEVEETRGEVRGLDMSLKKLQHQERTRPV